MEIIIQGNLKMESLMDKVFIFFVQDRHIKEIILMDFVREKGISVIAQEMNI
jgi:hypothetical protein